MPDIQHLDVSGPGGSVMAWVEGLFDGLTFTGPDDFEAAILVVLLLLAVAARILWAVGKALVRPMRQSRRRGGAAVSVYDDDEDGSAYYRTEWYVRREGDRDGRGDDGDGDGDGDGGGDGGD